MSEPIRVLQVVGTMDLGGAETFIMNLYRQIDRTKVQFDFLCQNRIESAYSEEIYRLGGRMFKVDGPSHAGFWGYQRQLFRFFKEHPEYTTVHAHQSDLNGVILSQAKKAGIPNRYSHSHIAHMKRSVKGNLMLAFFKAYFPFSVTKSFACANLAADYLYSGKLRKEVIIIPNSISTEKFRYSGKKKIEGLAGLDEPIIGHVGRFMTQKNHHFLIRIFSEIIKISPKAKLVLIGQGELMAKVKRQVEELGLQQNVLFLGSRTDIPELLSSFDLLLFPSLYEGLSVTCVEAQASGLPILTSTSVSSEIVLTDLVEKKPLEDSVQSWAEEAIAMMNRFKNNDRTIYADKVKEAGFDIKALAKKMENLYLKADNS